MAKQQVAEQEALGAAMNKTELFFENNGRKMVYVFIGLLIVAGLIFGYRTLVSQPRIEKAAAMIAQAQLHFEAETPDFEVALNGDENGAGFLEVIEQYGSTPAGNLAKHYAGICHLRMGDLDNAAAYLAQYSAVDGLPGAIINAQNLGLQGDIAVEKENYAEALNLYGKAVAAADNNMTAPMYLRKAAMAAKALGNVEEAKALIERIMNTYPGSMEARDADRLMGSLE